MRKILLPVILATFVLFTLPWNHTLTAASQKSEEKLYLWANDMIRQPNDPPYLSLHYRLRELYFSVDPHETHPVVFLGDSITDEGDWSALFPNSPVENRGIGGDTTLGVLNRLDEVIALKPSQIFLMIGTNDLCFGRSLPDIVTNYRRILTRFQTELPQTQVYIQSVLPFNDTIFPSRLLRTNDNIRKLNKDIKQLARQYDYPYINLVPAFSGPDGRLPARYTSDGLHLSDAGYRVWRGQIKGLVKVEK
ncbi:Hypothetical protein LUCI_4254 [Lucifera butyrica]|uniref:SGNH hydrolase-type esterase domain-containing protein n=1 Tax=Lucifera butyrica TaxID=1351585 RepID=A0A498RIX2_9FIRM|nr:GDSL-type esterase/lipase family protein [Lucifera butyrica]VBB08968.1 Hypothetical protein LUCI_4254 [Lucifera butyrica]